MSPKFQIFSGHFIHSLSLTQLNIFNGVILVDKDGIISKILEVTNENDKQAFITKLKLKNDIKQDRIVSLTKNQFFIPGLIDSHCHAPQIVNVGRGNDLSLLEWLNKYTFPTEAKYDNDLYASEMYTHLVKKLLKQGTTTCSYYATLHLRATKILADCMENIGQRGLVGKVCMDINSPDYYSETRSQCIEDNHEIVKYLKDFKLVQPIITPRFAISCSSELMKTLGRMSTEYNLPIQTHLSENKNEIDFVKQMYPDLTYAQVYDEHNLVNEKTILAHCVHLDNDEIELIQQRNAGISHCPTSNINLMSGLLDIRKILDKNIKLGIGTDFSGGYSSSMLTAIVNTVNTSKIVNTSPIDLKQAFYLATLGNAKLLNMENQIGNFAFGKFFDALVIDTTNTTESMLTVSEDGCIMDKFEKFIYTGDDRNISKVYVNARLVSSTN